MKIRDRYTGGIRQSGGGRERTKPETVAGTSRGREPSIRIQISGRSVEIQKARAMALQAPDIRQELVDEIRGQIDRGAYQVPGRDVVPKMIRDHLMGVGD